jgi:hypothetical protein
MSRFRTLHYLGEKMCKRSDSSVGRVGYGIPRDPGSRPSQTAHFSHPVTFGAQRGNVTDIAQSLIYIAL